MPKTVAEIKRIRRMHEAGDHDRCDVGTCKAARDEYLAMPTVENEVYEHERRLLIKALADELEAQDMDPHEHIAEAEFDGLDELDDEPGFLHRLEARATIKARKQGHEMAT